MHQSLNGVERFRGRHPVRADLARLALNLLFDSSDANLEKLVEIVAEDGHEFDPLHQRLRWILRFFQNAAVKLQPAQLAINKICRIRKIAFRVDCVRQKSKLFGGRYFGSRSLHKSPLLSYALPQFTQGLAMVAPFLSSRATWTTPIQPGPNLARSNGHS